MHHRNLAFCYLFLAFFAAPSHSAGGDRYTRIQTGGHVWEAKAINDHGEIVGSSATAYYFNGRETIYLFGLASTNRSFSALYGINNLGLAVGASTVGTNFPGPLRAFAFDTRTSAIRDLGSLAGPNRESHAYAVNDAGVIVGSSATSNSTNAVRFEPDGRITDLGTLGGWWSAAGDINERGDIVGTSMNFQGDRRAFLIPANGVLIELGTLGGPNSGAARINNHGDIVGSSDTADGSTRAFLYTNGKMIDLGTLGGISAAFDINDEGTIVGWTWPTNHSGGWTAFIRYPDGELRDLAAMVSVAGDDTLFRAKAINNRGEIAVSIFHPVYRTGVEFTSLLKPGFLSAQFQNNQLQLRAAAPPGKQLRLEHSPDLRAWHPLLTLPAGTEQSLQEPLDPQPQFYRIVAD